MCMGWRHCKQLAKGMDKYIYIYIVVVGGLVVSDSCDPEDCSLTGSSVHGILQARIL